MRKAGQGLPGPPSGRAVASSCRVPAGLRRRLGGFSRNDAHSPAAAEPAELHLPADQREQGVVAAPPHALAGVEVRAALADDDLARVHQLTAIALDAETLGLGVTAVAAGRRALLVCHLSPPPPSPGPRPCSAAWHFEAWRSGAWRSAPWRSAPWPRCRCR